MKLAWFTPFSRESAIARFSQIVVAELANVAEVDVCHFDTGEIRETAVPVRRYSSAASISDQAFARYDLAIYNLGNYLPYHREIYLLARRRPGLCILHDFVMHHFFASLYLDDLRRPEEYALLMERTYGEAGRAACGRRVWESDEVGRFPLFEEASHGALGAVTHSEFFRKRVEASFPGPVSRIPLPFDAQVNAPVLGRSELGIPESQVLVLTVGHVNPNKRITAVIDALGRIGPAAERVTYVVAGACPGGYRAELEARARRNGLGERFRLPGHVPDEILRSYLTQADICVNLRFPPIEGASGSVIEEMLFGKPVIVNDVGFFSELPDECVVKIHPDAHEEFETALKRLVGDQALRVRLGQAAQRFSQREFRVDRYARELMDFIWQVRSAQPLLGLADRVAAECSRMGITNEMAIVGTVAGEMNRLFCESKDKPPRRNRASAGSSSGSRRSPES